MKTSSTLLLPLAAALAAGCATGPAWKRAVDSSNLTLADAQEIISKYENRQALRHAARDADPLGNPKSLEDVLEVLRKDQIDLFPEALKFLETQPQGPQTLALKAQIQLAWGEAQILLDEMLTRASGELRGRARDLAARKQAGPLSADDEAELTRVNQTLGELAGIGEALSRVGGQHISEGAGLAQQLVASAPGDYHGYRVAADYYRLRGDWEAFDKAVAQLETLNPQSNGLLFARGMEALKRKQDKEAAEKLFRQALEKDPKFARAQVQLLLAQTGIIRSREELNKLRAINPNHQMAVWAGPAIDDQYQSWTAALRDARPPTGPKMQNAPQ